MPYRDKEKRRAVARGAMQKKRGVNKGVNRGVNNNEDVNPKQRNVNPSKFLSEEYKRVEDALQKGIARLTPMRRNELYSWSRGYREPIEPRKEDNNPAIIHALADLSKRAKLRRICESLNRRGLGEPVRYGINGPTILEVSELLEAF